MNKYFKPLDWEINNYLSYINEPSSIDLSPYLNYIKPEKIEEEESVSYSDPEGGLKATPELPILVSKTALPKSESIKLPKEETKGKSKLVYSNKTEFKDRKDFIKHFKSLYKAEGLNDDLALTLAKQDALESWTQNGLSGLARNYNNYGGIKAVGNQSRINMDTKEYIDGKNEDVKDDFRVFDSDIDYVRNKIKWLKVSKNFPGALDGDGDHYLDVITGRNPLGKRYATAPNYKEVIKSIKAKSGGVLKASTGLPLKNSYNDKDRYDYSGSDYIPPKGEHWPSRNPDTGLELKHPNHPTHKIGQYYDQKTGLGRFYNKYNNRYYTLEEWSPSRFIPGMEEVGYDLKPNPFDDRIGRYMKGHTKEDEYDR